MDRKKSCSHRHLKDESKLAQRGYRRGKRPLKQGEQKQSKGQKFPVASLERVANDAGPVQTMLWSLNLMLRNLEDHCGVWARRRTKLSV